MAAEDAPAQADTSKRDALRFVVDAYKAAKGMKKDTPMWKAWDRSGYPRYVRAAADIMEVFGNQERAAFFIITKGQELDEAGLNWNLSTIARFAWDDGPAFIEKSDNQQLGMDSTPMLEGPK